MDPDRALQGSAQALALLPGLPGLYIRRAFLSVALERCAPTSVVEFGVTFSRAGARLDDNVYVGSFCNLGLVHLEQQRADCQRRAYSERTRDAWQRFDGPRDSRSTRPPAARACRRRFVGRQRCNRHGRRGTRLHHWRRSGRHPPDSRPLGRRGGAGTRGPRPWRLVRLLALTHRLPWAPNRGDRIRTYHVLRALATRHEVHLLSLVHDKHEAAHVAEVRNWLASVTVLPVPRLRNLVKGAIQLPSATPLTFALLDAPRTDGHRASAGRGPPTATRRRSLLEHGTPPSRARARLATIDHRHDRCRLGEMVCARRAYPGAPAVDLSSGGASAGSCRGRPDGTRPGRGGRQRPRSAVTPARWPRRRGFAWSRMASTLAGLLRLGRRPLACRSFSAA